MGSLRCPCKSAFGSAKMGESYLYWHGDQLYNTTWTYSHRRDCLGSISPGFVDGDARLTPARFLLVAMELSHYLPLTSVRTESLYSRTIFRVFLRSVVTGPAPTTFLSIGRIRNRRRQNRNHQPPRFNTPTAIGILGQSIPENPPRKNNAFAFRPGDSQRFISEMQGLPRRKTACIKQSAQ